MSSASLQSDGKNRIGVREDNHRGSLNSFSSSAMLSSSTVKQIALPASDPSAATDTLPGDIDTEKDKERREGKESRDGSLPDVSLTGFTANQDGAFDGGLDAKVQSHRYAATDARSPVAILDGFEASSHSAFIKRSSGTTAAAVTSRSSVILITVSVDMSSSTYSTPAAVTAAAQSSVSASVSSGAFLSMLASSGSPCLSTASAVAASAFLQTAVRIPPTAAPVSPPEKHSMDLMTIIIVVAVVAAVLLIGGAACGYSFYRTHRPGKIGSDRYFHLIG